MHVMDSPPGARTIIDGRECDYFCGVSYLGLHGHRELLEAARTALLDYGMNPATTRAGFGNNPPTLALEAEAARFFGVERALYFISGYLGPGMLVKALASRFDVVLIDEYSHYSAVDAARVSEKPVVTYAHRDLNSLHDCMKAESAKGHRPLVLSDAIFPSYGDVPDLAAYADLAQAHDGVLILDDAHGMGILGANGRGTCEYLGLDNPDTFVCGTMSKAFGSLGGLIPGSNALINELIRRSHVPNAASGPDVAATAAALKGLELVSQHPEFRQNLHANVARLKSGIRRLGFKVPETLVPIVAFTLDTEAAMVEVQRELLGRGMAIAHFKYMGAPSQGVLRACAFATHSVEQIDRLVENLAALV